MAEARLNEIFGQNLRRYRESLEQPRQIFAAVYGGSAYTLVGYESGQSCPNLARFLVLCNTFELSPNTLLEGLFPWQTELEDIRELESLTGDLQGHRAQKFLDFQDIYIRGSIEVRPSLQGTSFGERLHLLRLENNCTIDALAESCSVSKPTMQGYESGQYDPTLRVILCLSEIFEVSPEYLLAPRLKKLNYKDSRIADLRPNQIKTLLALSRCFKDNL